MEMYLLNSRPVLECEEDEWDKHSQEILDINNQLQGFPDYNCAVIVQYQDEAHRGKHRIEQIPLHDVLDVFEWGDIKNGADLLLDEDGYLVFVSYGQGYKLKGKYHLITVAYQILTFDENKNFMNISKALLKQGKIEVSAQQFEKKPEFVNQESLNLHETVNDIY